MRVVFSNPKAKHLAITQHCELISYPPMFPLSLFDYHLPERLIAQKPAPKRDESRLMVVGRSAKIVSHSTFTSFPSMLNEGDVLTINTTRVIPARLLANRKSGGAVEILLARRAGANRWIAVTGGAQKVKPGETLIVGDGAVIFEGKAGNGMAYVSFSSEDEMDRIIKDHGVVPLPPYIYREAGVSGADDVERYQTVFASKDGSCAAPTAGLHFTEKILEEIRRKGVIVAPVILHVGPGTFKPVKTEDMDEHVMDPEPFEIPESSAQAVTLARKEGRRVIAVGSTVTRCLESVADEAGAVRACSGETDLFIKPGYRFKAVDAMLTNFHLPKSTLLVLVCAFAGRELALSAYAEAVREEYRFFSYGDAMFIG
jgi:S-adenosylmethionine:tRNA ribosyltransferase-isomerase